MEIPFVNLLRQHQPFVNDLQNSVESLLASNRAIGGKLVTDFESEFSNYLGVSEVVSCANGTDALEVVLRAWNIGVGDEVIVPANGWISVSLVVRLVGAIPVFLDCHQDSYNLDLNLLESKINKNTKAIIPIHLYGNPVEMDRLMSVAQQYHIKVLEDCAQAHGASLGESKVGSLGDAGIFSFYPTKNLGALGDGGAIVTSDRTLAERCRAIANYGQFQKHFTPILGRNSRLDTWQAKVLSIKLPHLEQWNRRRKLIAEYYLKEWYNLPIKLPVTHVDSVWHLFVVEVEYREQVRGELAKSGIDTEIHYPVPVCSQPVFKDINSPKEFPNALHQASKVLSIPIYPELTDGEVEYIVNTFRKVIEFVSATNQ